MRVFAYKDAGHPPRPSFWGYIRPPPRPFIPKMPLIPPDRSCHTKCWCHWDLRGRSKTYVETEAGLKGVKPGASVRGEWGTAKAIRVRVESIGVWGNEGVDDTDTTHVGADRDESQRKECYEVCQFGRRFWSWDLEMKVLGASDVIPLPVNISNFCD